MKQLSSLLIAILPALICSGPLLANPVAELQPVGSATLKVFFWTIYNSTLYTEDGTYTDIEPNLALQITYRRNIASRELLAKTEEEWQKTSPGHKSQHTWLSKLDEIWPDVRRGDVIVLRVNSSFASDFYFNDKFIGAIEDREFTEQFLSLWLSERSSYPKLRNILIGK